MTAISLLLVAAGHWFIIQRTAGNPIKGLSIRGDTVQYVAMIQGRWSEAGAPYSYRVLVPFLASLLPFSPTDALRIITYASLFVAYLVLLRASTRLGLTIPAAAVGLLTVWATPWHLYNYHNPFLTDAFGLLALCVMVYAMFSDSFYLFLGAAVAGILAREATIFLVPAWMICDAAPVNAEVKPRFWRSLLLIVLAGLALILPRLLIASTAGDSLLSAFTSVGLSRIQDPLAFAREIFNTWGFVWIYALMGIWYLPGGRFSRAAVALGVLLAGAAATTLVATDTGRMFTILTPVFAVACAHLYAHLAERSRVLAAGFIVLVIARALFALPNAVFGYGSAAFAAARQPMLYAEVGLSLLVCLALLHTLARARRAPASDQRAL